MENEMISNENELTEREKELLKLKEIVRKNPSIKTERYFFGQYLNAAVRIIGSVIASIFCYMSYTDAITSANMINSGPVNITPTFFLGVATLGLGIAGVKKIENTKKMKKAALEVQKDEINEIESQIKQEVENVKTIVNGSLSKELQKSYGEAIDKIVAKARKEVDEAYPIAKDEDEITAKDMEFKKMIVKKDRIKKALNAVIKLFNTKDEALDDKIEASSDKTKEEIVTTQTKSYEEFKKKYNETFNPKVETEEEKLKRLEEEEKERKEKEEKELKEKKKAMHDQFLTDTRNSIKLSLIKDMFNVKEEMTQIDTTSLEDFEINQDACEEVADIAYKYYKDYKNNSR